MTSTSADQIIALAVEFAERCRDEVGVQQAYLFGSLVYRDGERFSEAASDVDLAMVAPDTASDPIVLAELAEKLIPLKVHFELNLAGALSRSTASPVCSLMVVTRREIGADIHKDGAEGFFAANEFVELLTKERSQGLPGVRDTPVADRLVRQCLRFAQKKRHSFLAVAGNGRGSFPPYEAEAPLPKDVLRHAAMAGALHAGSPAPGAEFDTQEGLSEVLRFLTGNAKHHRRYDELRVWMMSKLSTRKGILEPNQHLLLAEIISWLAEAAQRRREEAAMRRDPPRVESTPFFFDRVNEAFPGKRGVYWTTGPKDVEQRLNRLLGGQLRYGRSTPIWLFRGGISIPISSFRQLDAETFLFDHLEVKVRRLALSQSESYYRCFVYVEGEPLSPIGINSHAADSAREAANEGRIYNEEYGLTDDGMIVTREEYDDGGAERNGDIISTAGRTEIRCRYLTPFNFLLCAQMAPINNSRWDRHARQILDRMLAGEDLLATLVSEIETLPRRDDD